ncbi:tyrosine-type recombinase/integrase [Clostridium psychrophilum]|uniref:tyrosine-type recombinase/integrase n=1 Tax=Clostridium psychrophilum TaxID=132926 RepID=UPI001C0C9EEC|nr:tyrosine-type recombinase/integrase [Clostridium psychrophilum]MBU3179565.1 tyrosine-type recombinase/integrase [Clostridium psychrophilum]
MELSIFQNKGKDMVILLDNKMRIVKPVYNYLKYKRLKDMALNTLKANGTDLKIYWNFLNKKGYEYSEITPNNIGEFIEYLREPNGTDDIVSIYTESQRTAKTINRILSTIYNFYKYCGMINEIDNPIIMDDINRPFNMFKNLLHHARSDNKTKQSIFKVKESKETFYLVQDDEAEAFLNALPTRRDKLIFKIMYFTGARVGEVLDLQIQDIPYPDMSKELEILENIKSKGKRRNLYIQTALVQEIDTFIMEERNNIDTEHSYIFVAQQKQNLGKPLTYRGIYEVFNTVKRKTKIYFNFHDLRHTFITHLVENGIDISVVMIIAGHEHVTTTQKYTHISKKYLEDSLGSYWKKSAMFRGGANGN